MKRLFSKIFGRNKSHRTADPKGQVERLVMRRGGETSHPWLVMFQGRPVWGKTRQEAHRMSTGEAEELAKMFDFPVFTEAS